MIRKYSVGARLAVSFSLLLILTLSVGAIAAFRVGSLREAVRVATQDVAAKSRAANTLAEAVNAGARNKLALFAATSPELIAQSTDGVATARKAINASYARLDTLLGDSLHPDKDALAQLGRVKELRKTHAAAFDSAAAVRKRGEIAQAEAMLTSEVLPSLVAYLDGINKLVDIEDNAMRAEAASVDAAAKRGLFLIAGLCLIAIFCGAVIANAIYRSITRPLGKLTQVANQLVDGDCEVQIADDDARDEVAALAQAMQRMAAADHGLAKAASALAAGDIGVHVTVRGERDVLGNAMARLKGTLGALQSVTEQATIAAREGRLRERASDAQFAGAYRELVRGLNATIDALLEPVTAARAALTELANRDMSARMPSHFVGEHAVLATALNSAAHELDQTLTEVAAAADQVTSASTQIASGSQSLARSASEQASSLEEVASSLQEIGSSTRLNAANAAEARALISEAQNSSSRGVTTMGQLSDAMNRIKQSSDATAKIVKSIDEIAFQTNLLALNAAVEAARAGDAGRGFAVVADEVRALALRSAEAAKQTSALIDESVSSTGDGVTLNGLVITQLSEIDAHIARAGLVVAEIAEASAQQRDGIEQIGTAVEQMNQVTQQVAASAEESASAAEELSSQATMLTSMVGEFQLTDVRHSTSSRRPSAGRLSTPRSKSKRVEAEYEHDGEFAWQD